MRAWSQLFNDYLTSKSLPADYSDQDYFDFVDGKPRYDGVASFLASRAIRLPWGTPGDSGDDETVCGLGNRKNALFNQVLDRDGIEAYPGSLALLAHLRATATAMAVVSSSRNARQVLASAKIADFFQAVVDGNFASTNHLAGKPAPDTFLRAAELLGVDARQAVVFEDAIAGVQAGAAGNFGLVVGVDRGAGADALRQAGAQIVVADLAELIA